jgi:hypothetical protein
MILKIKVTPKNQKEIKYREIIWDLKNQISIDDFLNEYPEYLFEKQATIVKTKGVTGYKIKEKHGFKNKKFLIYVLVIGGKIIKVGKSKNNIGKRSYTAGTERNWVATGNPSDVNYFYSKLFLFCLENNIDVDFYCYEVPIRTEDFVAFRRNRSFNFSPYEEFEKTLNEVLIEKLGGSLIGDGELFLDYKE